METILELNKGRFNYPKVIVSLIYIIPFFLSLFSNVGYMISFVILILSLLIWRHNEFYYILPIFIFFYSELLLPVGLTLYRVYTLLLLAKLVLNDKFYIEKLKLIPLLIVALYCTLVISHIHLKLALFTLFDFFLIVAYSTVIIKTNLSKFFSYYVFAIIMSSLFGWFKNGLKTNAYTKINNEWIEVSRFVGSLEDPNYFGFFINIAIFAIIILKPFNRNLSILILLFLYLNLIATMSITGFLCNLMILVLYFVLSKRVKINQLLILGFLVLALLFNVKAISTLDIPIVSDMSTRINGLLNIVPDSDYDSLTTKRSSIWLNHLQYYLDQPTSKMLFGGNYITDFGFDSRFKSVSHQVYIDMLLNFGLIGTLIMILFLLYLLFFYIKKYYETYKLEYLYLVIIKVIWIFYSFGLSMFPSWKFNLFFLL